METSAVTNDNIRVSTVKLGRQTCLAPRSIGKRSKARVLIDWSGTSVFSRESEAHAGEIKKIQLEKYGESRGSHLGLQCLTIKSWLNIIAVPMGAPTALKNKKTI